MATHRRELDYTSKLLAVAVSAMFAQPGIAETDEFRHSRGIQNVSESVPSPRLQVILHPGVVVSVVTVIIVSIAAVLAAAFIIRKYCFSPSEATYRYSVLRQLEEHSAAGDEGDKSDEDLLE